MNWKVFVVNWKTTVGGIMTAVPPVITAAGFVFSPNGQHWLALCSGLGALLLGFSAKDASTHSTAQEVQQATRDEK